MSKINEKSPALWLWEGNPAFVIVVWCAGEMVDWDTSNDYVKATYSMQRFVDHARATPGDVVSIEIWDSFERVLKKEKVA